MPHAELLDPQGKTVIKNMKNINVEGVQDVRIGKHISMTFEAEDKAAAEDLTKKTCEKLLANVIMEKFEFQLHEIEEEVVEIPVEEEDGVASESQTSVRKAKKNRTMFQVRWWRAADGDGVASHVHTLSSMNSNGLLVSKYLRGSI